MAEEQKEAYKRPSWDEYFLGIAKVVATRGTCDRVRLGCVITRDKQILVTGYNGSPRGLPHCDEAGHLLKETTHEDGHKSIHCERTIHAEQNAICQAANLGISLNGGTIYLQMVPCRRCTMLLINCGIKRVVAEKRYHAGAETEELLKEAGIELVILDEAIVQYANQK